MYFEGELPVMSYGNCNNNGNSGWNDWSWIIGLALVGGLFGGWGNGGFGFGGNRGGYGFNGVGENYVLATDFATIERKIDGVNAGLCDGFYAQNTNMLNGFASVQQTLCQGFNGIERSIADTNSNLANAICTLGYQNQAGFNALSTQLAQCCCDTRAAIADVKYANERNTNDIIRAGQDNTRAILDYLTTEKISALQAENSGLKAQISNDRQSAYIIDALAPKCPQPAYVVQPPQQVTFPTNCCGNVAYANYGNGGCGCN
jgi:hypothetical protein